MIFSIVTPTLQRQSLIRCCQSVDLQTFRDYEHIVWIDSEEINCELFKSIQDDKRFIYSSKRKHGNFGNHARNCAWRAAKGEYVIWLDDDNFLGHPKALQDIHDSLMSENWPEWALFPIYRHGSYFLLEPPGMCMTDSANMVVKWEIGEWPDIEAREADGILAERLKHYPYASFPSVLPIVVMEVSSNGI